MSDTKILVHGQYNERHYEILLQRVGEDADKSRSGWEEEYRRSAGELGERPRLDPDRMKKYCQKTAEEVAEEKEGAEVGQVMYLPMVFEDDSESEVPEGHESW